jgi:hypothetical protein
MGGANHKHFPRWQKILKIPLAAGGSLEDFNRV